MVRILSARLEPGQHVVLDEPAQPRNFGLGRLLALLEFHEVRRQGIRPSLLRVLAKGRERRLVTIVAGAVEDGERAPGHGLVGRQIGPLRFRVGRRGPDGIDQTFRIARI